MNKLILIALIIILPFAVSCKKSSEDTTSKGGKKTASGKVPDVKRYKIKSGIIEYALSGMQKGKETLYFDKWGWREARYTESEVSIGGMTQKTNQLSLLDGKWTYNIDLVNRTGIKMETPLLKELTANAQGKDLTDIGMKMMKDMGGKKIGEGEVAGKKCEIWEVMGAKTWLWNGLTLKTEAGFGGMNIVSTATNVQINTNIPSDKVTIPSDIQITEAGNIQDLMKKMKK